MVEPLLDFTEKSVHCFCPSTTLLPNYSANTGACFVNLACAHISLWLHLSPVRVWTGSRDRVRVGMSANTNIVLQLLQAMRVEKLISRYWFLTAAHLLLCPQAHWRAPLHPFSVHLHSTSSDLGLHLLLSPSARLTHFLSTQFTLQLIHCPHCERLFHLPTVHMGLFHVKVAEELSKSAYKNAT